MPRRVALSAIERVLTDARYSSIADGGMWDFIGGEPLLEAELVDEIVRHVLRRSYQLDHPWFARHQFSLSTNGLLYSSPAAQRLTRYPNFEMQISIDGPEDVHDSQRGAGSYAQIMRSFALWRKQYPGSSTKATLAPATIGHLARSVMHLLVDLELPQVNINPVFEAVWSPADAAVYEAQLNRLLDEMIAAGLKPESCSLFTRHCGRPARELEDKNWCGCGKWMLAVDWTGRFYPCNRFAPSSLRPGRDPLVVGDVEHGIDWKALEPFERLKLSEKRLPKCLTCEVAGGCAWCTGLDYDEGGSIYHGTDGICELHRARARVNRRLYGDRRQG